MAEYREQVSVAASAEEVWRILYDVASWPMWTPTVRSASVVSGAPLAVGSEVRLKQPRIPAATWVVTALEPGISFDWTSTSPGVCSLARHRIEPTADGCRVTLTFEQTGRAAGVTGRLLGRLIRGYVATEAASIKRQAESGPPTSDS